MAAAYALWACIFFGGKDVIIISTKDTTAQEILRRIKLASDHLPKWLRMATTEYNKRSIRFSNNSSIRSISSAKNSARTFSASLLIIDECAFIEGIEEIWAASQPILSTVKNGKVILLSTPNGQSNFFYKMFCDDKNGFVKRELHWNLHPERNDLWKEKQVKDIGPEGFNQEYDCSFLASGDVVIDLNILNEYKNNHMVCDPIVKEQGNDLWIWEYPQQGKRYCLFIDVASGTGPTTVYVMCLILTVLFKWWSTEEKLKPNLLEICWLNWQKDIIMD